jgi:hypothetical protein
MGNLSETLLREAGGGNAAGFAKDSGKPQRPILSCGQGAGTTKLPVAWGQQEEAIG